MRIEAKNISCIRIQSISMAKATCWIKYTKRKKQKKNGVEDRKALCKLMNNAVYEKTMENLESI